MTREEQLEKQIKKSHQRYERLVGIVKDKKTVEMMDEIESDFDDTIEEIKSLDELPDIDVVIVLENGDVREVYGLPGIQYKVVDMTCKINQYDFEQVKPIGDLRSLYESLEAEEIVRE